MGVHSAGPPPPNLGGGGDPPDAPAPGAEKGTAAHHLIIHRGARASKATRTSSNALRVRPKTTRCCSSSSPDSPLPDTENANAKDACLMYSSSSKKEKLNPEGSPSRKAGASGIAAEDEEAPPSVSFSTR